MGAAKANLPIAKCFALSIMGGIFIAFGGALAVSVGPNCPGVAQANPGLLKMITGATTAVITIQVVTREAFAVVLGAYMACMS